MMRCARHHLIREPSSVVILTADKCLNRFSKKELQYIVVLYILKTKVLTHAKGLIILEMRDSKEIFMFKSIGHVIMIL